MTPHELIAGAFDAGTADAVLGILERGGYGVFPVRGVGGAFDAGIEAAAKACEVEAENCLGVMVAGDNEGAMRMQAMAGALMTAAGDIRGLSGLALGGLRPEVIAFACLMEHELRNNDHKSGWKGESPLRLAKRVVEEADELKEVAFDADTWGAERFRERVGEEAADVANMAMMVADVCGCLKA